ncbi:MAG: DUF4292 domain-containing protein [Bacteroidia bacterium]|nr:DUF4292 domain-containing protein [Bacteroidia bacterium]
MTSATRLIRPALWPLLAALMALSACKGTKTAAGDPTGGPGRQVLVRAARETVAFRTVSMSGKMNVQAPAAGFENLSASYRLELAKDSLMLIRVTKIIEVMRILVTRDSIYVLDKINRTVMASGYAAARDFTGLDADFGVLQDLMLGNFHQVPEELELEKRGANPLVFRGSAAGTQFSYQLDPKTAKTLRVETSNPERNQATALFYGDFEPYGGTLVPMSGGVQVTLPDTFSFDFQHRKFELNPAGLTFNFEIPEDYTRISPR